MKKNYARPGPIIKYHGGLNRSQVSDLVNQIGDDEAKDRIAFVVMQTPGGDAAAAYQLGRLLQRRYAGYILIVDGYCKSAGTIFALGALQVLFMPMAELGPIDVQLRRKDEISGRESGLETVLSTQAIIEFTFSTFEAMLLQTVARSDGAISSMMAAGLAAQVAGTLGSQLASQLDPVALGRIHRALAIAQEYGRRLDVGNVKPHAISSLMTDFPDHGFVIDVEEAKSLFRAVGVCDAPLKQLVASLRRDPDQVKFLPSKAADDFWNSTGINKAWSAAAAADQATNSSATSISASAAAAQAATEAQEAAQEAAEVAKETAAIAASLAAAAVAALKAEAAAAAEDAKPMEAEAPVGARESEQKSAAPKPKRRASKASPKKASPKKA